MESLNKANFLNGSNCLVECNYGSGADPDGFLVRSGSGSLFCFSSYFFQSKEIFPQNLLWYLHVQWKTYDTVYFDVFSTRIQNQIRSQTHVSDQKGHESNQIQIYNIDCKYSAKYTLLFIRQDQVLIF
jgi:hypothetical protein